MSGGISAIKGFDYQAMVILDRLFEHFDRPNAVSLARPEGVDDLDLIWTADGVEHRRYEQVKKPREDRAGNLKPSAWTLGAAIDELLPDAVAHLAGNGYDQVWVLGDSVSAELKALIDTGEQAAAAAAKAYWKTVHGLARNDAIAAAEIERPLRRKLLGWRVPASLPAGPVEALARIVTGFVDFAKSAGADDAVAVRYRERAEQIHDCLPDVLARIEIMPAYGVEPEVARRVFDRLEKSYRLSRAVIENTLFRNLMGFITDVAKQPGRCFDRVEFEFVLRSAWPHMLPVRDPPPLVAGHVARRDLTERFSANWTGNALEAIGISGSGKTSLASEVVEHSRRIDPDRRVYFAAVRGETTLRDVLVGVGFQLRRLGIPEPFALSVESSSAEEDLLARLARAYSALSQQILLLLDLADGGCTDVFARDFACFIRALRPGSCRIAVFGQESALRELTPLQRDECGVSRLDIRGFRFEEFVTLVGHHHPDPDRAALWDIYQRVTAGRSAGLFAKLADSLARAGSLAEMSEMAARPAGDILARAEQQRFARLSPAARNAAEKLLCFALPFRREDAEQIFPDDAIGAAIPELLDQGLLQPLGQDLFEMHETVRAGLEGTIAPNVRRSAHNALAGWYAAQGLVTAEILHLEQAGRRTEAESCAREAFLRGERWSALAPYVTGRKLVSAEETIGVLADDRPVDDKYLLSSILRGLGEPVEVDRLFQILRDQPDRCIADYHWGLAIVEAILDFKPNQLHDLIVFVLETAADATRRESALNWLLIAARRKGSTIGPPTIAFFEAQAADVKRLLLRFLVLCRRRDGLRPVFQFLATDLEPAEQPHRPASWRDLTLQLGKREDTVEFLAALPAAEPAAMMLAKSALLGPLASLVWAQRQTLRAHCLEILQENGAEGPVLINAIRVLVFLAEPAICALCEPLMSRNDAAGGLAKLVPALVPGLCDRSLYEARLLDCDLPLEERTTALFVLASAGADLGDLYTRVKAAETDAQKAEGWDFWFLMLCPQAPFAEAIPLLEQRLKTADENGVHILVPALAKLGELPVPKATDMLMRALSHPHLRVRQCAAVGLTQRRSRRALPDLIGHCARESMEVLAVGLATAILASGPKSVADLPSAGHDTPAFHLWQCILAMRVRDTALAGLLVRLANDPAQNWQLRRAAVFAAGRLPYEAALEKIVPIVMAERSPLTIDRHQGFRCHGVVSSALLCGADGMAQIFARGRAGFVEFFSELFEAGWRETWSPEGLPSGAEAAGWLFDRLVHHGWPARREAPDAVLNEISVPMLHSAVLRGLRMSGRPELIDKEIARADHLWLAMKCLLERSRSGQRGPALAARLKDLVEASPCRGNAMLHRVIAEIGGSSLTPPAAGKPGATGQPPEPAIVRIGYDEAARVLSGEDAEFKPAGPLVLDRLTPEQCADLIKMADPINDSDRGVETYVPSVEFTQNGHVVARRRVTFTGGAESARALVRPAVAAANSFGLPNPWHEELLTGPLAAAYLPKYLACLGARDESGRFYEELGRHEELLAPLLCNAQQAQPVLKYVDARIVPFLARYVSSGTDELFEGLSMLALRVETPEINPVLSGLLHRWARRYDVHAIVLQHDQNHALWRGFNRLAEHPRFTLINGWQSTLASVLPAPMSWFRAENIVRVLERDPRSYILIESRLFKAANWEHFHWDEIDRLDDAAERLFHELLEE